MSCRTATAPARCSSRFSPINGMSTPRRWRSRRSRRCARRKTVFVPAQWEATFFNWMENIQPWCVSRQIWWGHQIPAWYGPGRQDLRRRDRRRCRLPTRSRITPRSRRSRSRKAMISPPIRRGARALPMTISSATRMCSTPGSRRRCGRSRRWAGRTRRRSSSASIRPPRSSPASTSSSSGSRA